MLFEANSGDGIEVMRKRTNHRVKTPTSRLSSVVAANHSKRPGYGEEVRSDSISNRIEHSEIGDKYFESFDEFISRIGRGDNGGAERLVENNEKLEKEGIISQNKGVSELDKCIRLLSEASGISQKTIRNFVINQQELQIGRSASLSLPDKAPLLYAERRDKSQNIIDFLHDPDAWGPYVKAGILTRADFRRLDSRGERALQNWIQRYGLPDDLPIPPTRSQVVDAELASAKEQSLKAAQRLLSARARRHRRPTM